MDSSDEEDVQSFFGVGHNYPVNPNHATIFLESDDEHLGSDIDVTSESNSHNKESAILLINGTTTGSNSDVYSVHNVEENEDVPPKFRELGNKNSNVNIEHVRKQSLDGNSPTEEAVFSNENGKTRKRFVLQNKK